MSESPRFAVVLSGCGVFDGSEIHESVLTLLAISRIDGKVDCFAPDVPQYHVVDHVTGEPTNEQRNALTESARIARGAIRPLADFDPTEFDALIFPGGFGAAKTLCTFAFDGPDCTVEPSVEKAIRQAYQARLPIGAWCIAPVLIARVLGDVVVTVGNDPEVEKALSAMGAAHLPAGAKDAVIDRENRIVSTPCYMTDAPLADIAEGISAAVGELVAMMNQ